MVKDLSESSNSPNSLKEISETLGVDELSLTEQSYMKYVGEELIKASQIVAGDEADVIERKQNLISLFKEINNERHNLEKSKNSHQFILDDKTALDEANAETEENPPREAPGAGFVGGSVVATLSGMVATGGWSLALTAAGGAVTIISGVIADKKDKERKEKELENNKETFEEDKSNKLAEAKNQINIIKKSLQKYHNQKNETQTELSNVQVSLKDNRYQERLFGASDALAHCVERNGSTIQKTYKAGGYELQNLVEGNHDLADLELLINEATNRQINSFINPDKYESNKPEIMAIQAFVSHVVIPHLDFFVMQAQENEPNLSDVKARDYPTLEKIGNGSYNLNKLPDNLSNSDIIDAKGESIPTLNLSFMRDPSQGTIKYRLSKAMDKVDLHTKDVTAEFQILGEIIEKNIKESGLKTEELKNIDQAIIHGNSTNKSLDGRIKATRFASEKSLEADKTKDNWQQYIGLSSAALGSFLMMSPEPHTHIAGELIMHWSIAETVDHAKASKSNIEASEYVVAGLESEKIDVQKLEKFQEIITNSIKELKNNTEMNSLLKDQAKVDAISEAFIAKYMLSEGKYTTNILNEKTNEKTNKKTNPKVTKYGVDDLIKDFDPESRIGEALQNMCFGHADSNDLSIVLAESNILPSHPKEVHEQVLKEFVEEIIKPNIEEVCENASKVDLIYQANLTGVGTPFHVHRQTIRGENDRHTAVLFADSFGVESEIGDLTVAGAYDVKNLFGYRLHKHGGDDWITDEAVQDGVFGKEREKKSVSIIPDSEMAEHVKVSKAAKGVRREGPEISNMFLRICGYEYTYPQSVNSAHTRNIMADNPESPASYMMANKVIKEFVNRLVSGDVDKYHEKVGDKLDNLIAQTFMDFFGEIGRQHAESPEITYKKADIKMAASESGKYGRMLDGFSNSITNDALSQFSKFQEIYAKNLEKTLEHSTEENRAELEKQIDKVKGDDNRLAPNIVHPSSHASKVKAEQNNHSFENTSWKVG